MKKIELYVSSIYSDQETEKIIVDRANKFFDSYSLCPIKGIWNKKGEQSFVLILLTKHPQDLEKIRLLAGQLKNALAQETVLLTVSETYVEVI